jgi:hypothetical protein
MFVLVGNCGGGTCCPGDGVFVADMSNPTSTTQQNWTAATMADPNCAEFLSGGMNPINPANPGITFDSVADYSVGWPNQRNSVYIKAAVDQRRPEASRGLCMMVITELVMSYATPSQAPLTVFERFLKRPLRCHNPRHSILGPTPR